MKPNSSIAFLRACGQRMLFVWALLLASGAALAQSADLALTKTVDMPTPNVGTTVTFTLDGVTYPAVPIAQRQLP